MKNSKVLSLLTAGALVVSSFSGLAMNSGVARAAEVTAPTAIGAKLVQMSTDNNGATVLYVDSTADVAANNEITLATGFTAVGVAATYAGVKTGALSDVKAGTPAYADATATNVKVDGTAAGVFSISAKANDSAEAYIAIDETGASKVTDNTLYYHVVVNKGAVNDVFKITTDGTNELADNTPLSMNGKIDLRIPTAATTLLNGAGPEWEVRNAAGAVLDTTVATLTNAKGARNTLTLRSGALVGDVYTVAVKSGATDLDTVTIKVTDEVAREVTTMTVTEYNGNTDVTGKTVTIQANDKDIKQDVTYDQVSVGADATIVSNGLNLKWSADDGKTVKDPKYAWKVTKVTTKKPDGTTVTTKDNPEDSDWNKYFTVTEGAKNNAKRFAVVYSAGTTSALDAASLGSITAEIEVSVEGYAAVIDAANVTADYYKGKKTFTLTVLATRSSDVTTDARIDVEGPTYLEAGDGEYKKIKVNGKFTNLGRFTEDDLQYGWTIVTAGVVNGFLADYNSAMKQAADKGIAAANQEAWCLANVPYFASIKALKEGVSGTDAANVFELDGTETYGNTIKARAMSNASAGTYKILVQVYGNKAQREASKYNMLSSKENAGWALVSIDVINANMSVTLHTDKINENGLVKLPDGAKDYENAVTVTSAGGTNLTERASYSVFGYEDYQNYLATYGTTAAAIKYLEADKKAVDSKLIKVDKGKLTVTKKAEGGAYVVVATHPNLGTKGVSADCFMVKTANGVDVTGLELDQNDIILDNKTETAKVYATVLPVSYYSNGYTAKTEESAEIVEITAQSSDEAVVVAQVVAGEKPVKGVQGVTYDGTRTVLLTAKGAGEAQITVTTVDGGFSKTIDVTVRDSVNPEPTPEPEPEHKAGEAFTVDGVSVFVNADGKTLTVIDVAVVGKTATIPATVDGLEVTTIAAQAFKKTDAKTIYVKAAVTDIEKGAFKKAKTKKIFFYEPAALNTVAKNAFKGANIKVVGVGGSFSESAASQLKKAGASKVKNNGTAK